MPNLNKVMLMGNLTRDPEVKYTPKGTAIAELGLAVNRSYVTDQGEKREEVTFIDVEMWGRQAEIAGEYLKKGRPVFIEGRLKLDTWDDKQTGQKRSKMRVVGEHMQMLGSREGGPGGGGGGGGGGSGSNYDEVDAQASSSRPASFQKRPSPPPPPQQQRKPADPDLDAPAEEDDVPF
jgi:single-strand DNA-binding protein